MLRHSAGRAMLEHGGRLDCQQRSAGRRGRSVTAAGHTRALLLEALILENFLPPESCSRCTTSASSSEAVPVVDTELSPSVGPRYSPRPLHFTFFYFSVLFWFRRSRRMILSLPCPSLAALCALLFSSLFSLLAFVITAVPERLSMAPLSV